MKMSPPGCGYGNAPVINRHCAKAFTSHADCQTGKMAYDLRRMAISAGFHFRAAQFFLGKRSILRNAAVRVFGGNAI